ncbi:UNVERIFIED_CONTAM: hypothetical protein K2H54_014731 [Gekko kuhli]
MEGPCPQLVLVLASLSANVSLSAQRITSSCVCLNRPLPWTHTVDIPVRLVLASLSANVSLSAQRITSSCVCLNRPLSWTHTVDIPVRPLFCNDQVVPYRSVPGDELQSLTGC